jgi:mRNA-degrading endonuclease YafQ of YafQ-DinJ toxin-antitoxin module
MTAVEVVMMPPFKRAYKKMHSNQKKAVNEAITVIVANPQAGELKKGDLAGVYVYKFECVNQLMLLSYEYDPKTRTLLYLGVHENFYRDMKRK